MFFYKHSGWRGLEGKKTFVNKMLIMDSHSLGGAGGLIVPSRISLQQTPLAHRCRLHTIHKCS